MEPLAAIVAALRPRAASAKIISGAGKWGARYSQVDNAGFGLVLSGECWLRVEPVRLAEGDFVLMPPNPGFSIYSDAEAELVHLEPAATAGLTELHHGERYCVEDFKLLGGYFCFEPANATLLARLLPALVHIRRSDSAAKRLTSAIDLITDEALGQRPGRDFVVERLIEVMLVEALRFRPDEVKALARPGLLSGLADPNLAKALRSIHADVARHWTVAELSREAGLSRSTFSDRFTHRIGLAPMEYVIQWRMALAKTLLLYECPPLEQVAAAIGYESASAFSTAFRKQVGQSPSHFARASAKRDTLVQ